MHSNRFTVALGFLFGKLRYKAIALGAVTGCLVAGLLLGAQASASSSAAASASRRSPCRACRSRCPPPAAR
ncbi:hypothetical protein [Streptomyces sp. NPDC052494]|uniref:aspartate-alanine antiporter-like transporter n=1 Tax=Streptomyces sp. NPDC052494 TaxID=3365692 RepID=UPI0037D5608C